MGSGSRALLLATLAAAACMFLASGPARADEQAEARAHFENGIALSDEKTKDYEGALVEFEASVRLFPTRAGLYNLALCYRRLARYGEALAAYERLLEGFAAELDAELRGRIDQQVTEIRRMTAELDIEVDRDGATVLINGETVATSPLAGPLHLGPREYRIEVALDGFKTAERRIKLVSGQRHRERFALEEERAELTVTTGEVAGATVKVDGEEVGATPLAAPLLVEPGQHTVEVFLEGYARAEPQHVELQPGQRGTLSFALLRLPEEPEAERPRPSALFWTGAGLTVAAGVAAGALFGAAGARYDDFEKYDDRIAENYPTHPDAASWVAARDAAEQESTLYQNLAIGFAVGAGVLAAAAVTVLILDLSGGDEDGGGAGGRARVTATPGGVTVSF